MPSLTVSTALLSMPSAPLPVVVTLMLPPLMVTLPSAFMPLGDDFWSLSRLSVLPV